MPTLLSLAIRRLRECVSTEPGRDAGQYSGNAARDSGKRWAFNKGSIERVATITPSIPFDLSWRENECGSRLVQRCQRGKNTRLRSAQASLMPMAMLPGQLR
jgi:hypothetical protein